jgi:hypothetical protein
MSPLRFALAFIALAAGQLYYSGCRTPQTLANRLWAAMLGGEGYANWTATAAQLLGPAGAWHGSAPSFLWTLAASMLAMGWSISWRPGSELPLLPIPAALNAAWELTQAAGLNDGHADLADALAGIAAGLLVAAATLLRKPRKQRIPALLHWQTGIALGCLCLISLADVWK